MSNDYFKAQGWFKNYATSSEDSRGMFQQLVKEDEEAFRIASAETDRIKNMINEKFGPGTMKPASELPPVQNPFDDFEDRNPMAGIEDETREYYLKYLEDRPEGSKGKPIPLKDFAPEFIRENAAEGGRMGFSDGLSALSFGKEQNIFTPLSFQKILGAAGQKKNPQSYKIIVDALKKAGITYTPRIGGLGADFDNVTKKTINIFNKEATKLRADAGLPMSRYQTDKIKKDIVIFVKDKIKNGEYISRPVILEHFGLDKQKGNKLITRSLGKKVGPDTYEGGLLNKLGQEEKKAIAKANFAKASAVTMETKNNVLKIINDEFKLDPDLSNSEDLARTIYGDQFPKGDMKNMSIEDLRKAESLVRQTDNDVMSYLRVIKGLRDKPDGMRLPTQNVINDINDTILSGIEDESAPGQGFKKKGFRFSSGLLRDYKMALINKNLGLDPDTYRSERAKKILKNQNLDEVFSMSALADIAPGYTTKVQSIKKLINTKKADKIDLPFQRIMNALNEGKTSMQWNGEIVPIEDAIKSFNKTSSEFSKKNKVQSPKINYNEKLDEAILDSYGKASQENIKKVYKDKNFFLSDIDPKIKTEDVLIDYIDGKGGTTLSSGFNTDLFMKDKAVQKILNSKAAQAVKNAAKGTAGTVGKGFGVVDLVIGALDYANNKSKEQSDSVALGNAVQAMSFNLLKTGDKARINEIKDLFVKNGGDGEIFKQATDLNAKDQEINDLIYKSKFTADKAFMDLSQPQAILGKSIDQRKEDYGILKKQLNEKIKNTIEERDNMVKSYKTNLQVSEAGAPINIGGQEFFSKPFKDIKRTTLDKIEEENRASFPMQKEQLNYTSGNIGNVIENEIITLNAKKNRDEQRLIKEMAENYPQELYRFNLERNVDPDNLIRFEDVLDLKSRYPELMGVNTTKYINKRDQKSEGGITTLRSKYEYKK